MFYIFLYVVEGPLDDFDPEWDLLLSPVAYMTWRKVGQNLPTTGQIQLYGAVYPFRPRGGSWMIVKFDPQRTFLGVETWISYLADEHRPPRLGDYNHSPFHRLFSAPSNFEQLEIKLGQINDLLGGPAKPVPVSQTPRSEQVIHWSGAEMIKVSVPDSKNAFDAWPWIREQICRKMMEIGAGASGGGMIGYRTSKSSQ